MLNVRIDKDLEKKLTNYSLENNSTKSSIVKEALAMYFTKKETKETAYEMGSGLFGAAGSGNENASTTYKKKLKEKLNEKHAH
jgi:predicted transcriptional regulator